MPHKPSEMEKLKWLRFDLRRRERRLYFLRAGWLAVGLLLGYLLGCKWPLVFHPH